MDVDCDSTQSVQETAVSIDDMIAALQKSPATLKWMTVDACRADPIDDSDTDRANTKDLVMPDTRHRSRPGVKIAAKTPEPPENFVFLQSCEEGQFSIESPELEQGLMTYALLEALAPKDNPAQRTDNGELTLGHLLSYVQVRTKELANLCTDKQNRPRVQNPAVTVSNNVLNLTILTNLHRTDLTELQRREIAEKESDFENYLANTDFERAWDALGELAELYPGGVDSPQYKKLEEVFNNYPRPRGSRRLRDHVEYYEEAQRALRREEYVVAIAAIDRAIMLKSAPEYLEFRTGSLTDAVNSAVNQAIDDGEINTAKRLNTMLAELDAEAANANADRIESIQKSSTTAR